MSTLNMDDVERQTRALLDSRMESVRALVLSRQSLADLHQQVAQAEREDVKHYNAALSAGWTAAELRQVGINEPAKKKRTSRRTGASKSNSGVPDKGPTPPHQD